MTRLLVSVRDAAEARVAVEEGVDLIDLKEPNYGSLGRATSTTACEVSGLLDGRTPLSMALGELIDYFPPPAEAAPTPLAVTHGLPSGLSFVKLGLAGCANSDWSRHWRELARRLPRGVGRVYVVYADAALAKAPAMDDIVEEAAKADARAVLVDTYTKDGRGLFDFWTGETLRRLTADVQRHGMLVVVGGGLTTATIPQAAECEADFIAVRGAACEGPRTGTVSAAKIRDVKRLLR
jgi:uncharacterized protein (UPF0264 family)